uniref:FTH domain-containing protein n=1 Tax=Panagrellus redivivus TaxID=6233 RepID=A0A7E4UXX5_PANRE
MTKAGHKPFICFNQLSALAEYVTTVEIKSGKESLFNKKWFPEDIEELLIDTQIAEKLSDKAISRLAHAVPNVIKVEGVTHHVLNIAEKVIFESANPSPKTMFNNVKTLHILDIMIDNTFNASYIEAIERFLERFPAVKDVTVYMQGKSFYDYSDEKFVESRKVFFNTKFKPNINLYVDCRLKTNLNPQLLETGLSVVDKKRSKWTFEYGNERQRLFVGKQT